MIRSIFPISPNDSINVVTKIFILILEFKNLKGLRILSNLNILMNGIFRDSMDASSILEITIKKSNRFQLSLR